MTTFKQLTVFWPRRTSLTTPTYPLRGLPSFVITTCVPIHGTLSALDKESSAFSADGMRKKGTVANFNQLTWHSCRCKTNQWISMYYVSTGIRIKYTFVSSLEIEILPFSLYSRRWAVSSKMLSTQPIAPLDGPLVTQTKSQDEKALRTSYQETTSIPSFEARSTSK